MIISNLEKEGECSECGAAARVALSYLLSGNTRFSCPECLREEIAKAKELEEKEKKILDILFDEETLTEATLKKNPLELLAQLYGI